MARMNPIQLQKYLKGVDYPASKHALLAAARQHNADENVRAALEQLPDKRYESPAAVSKAISKEEQE